MPAFEIKDLPHDALLWEPTGTDRYGQTVVGDPAEVKVRWNTSRRNVLDAKGDTVALDATVIAKQVISIGSRLWKGLLDDWVGTGSGAAVTDEEVHEVKTVKITSDIKGRNTRYEYGLIKFRDIPPA